MNGNLLITEFLQGRLPLRYIPTGLFPRQSLIVSVGAGSAHHPVKEHHDYGVLDPFETIT